MTSNTYTEEEFKKVLKNLFAEKKRVKDLEKQLEEKGLQKRFQAKLTDIHKLSLSEEYAKLKAALQEKETECGELKLQMDRVRPALKKLMVDLKSATFEIETLKAQQHPEETEELKKAMQAARGALESTQERNDILEKELANLMKEREALKGAQRQIGQLHEELDGLRKKESAYEDDRSAFNEQIRNLSQELADSREALAQTQAHEQKGVERFEAERGRLVERLAETLGQMQRQAEMLTEHREEIAILRKQMEGIDQQKKLAEQELLHMKTEQSKTIAEADQTGRMAEYQLKAMREEKEIFLTKISQVEEEMALLQGKLEEQCKMDQLQKEEIVQLRTALESAQVQLQESDFVALRAEYEVKVQEALMTFSQKEVAHEESLERSYVKMREMTQRHAEIVEEREMLYKKVEDHNKFLAKFEKEQGFLQTSLKNVKLQCEEAEAELRKAQQHLAKKVKESTILRDLADSQKIQIMELQAGIEKQTTEIERLQNSVNLQRAHDEKLQEMMKERAQAAENQTKEWENKYLALQQDLEEKKGQLIELQKLRKTYEQMASTFSSLKTILGNNLEPLQSENPQDPGN